MGRKLGILLNTSWYIYNFRKNLIKELILKGFEVHTIAPNDEYTEKLKELGSIHHDIRLDSRSKNPFKNVSLLFQIHKILSEINPDVLLNFTIKPNVYGTFIASRIKIPCINNVAGLGTLYSESRISRIIFILLFRYTQKKAAHIFFQNQDDFYNMTGNKIVKESISSILPGSGVDLGHFSHSPLELKENGKIIFLLVARMIYPKGILEVSEASKKLVQNGYDNFEIKLLGESEVNNPDAIPTSVLEDICKSPFISYLSKTDDVRPFIKECDVMVLPSYYREGTPKSLLEALAVGRPIITTDNSGCRDTVLENQNGYICQSRSIDSLYSKMLTFLNLSFEEKAKMGKRSRKLAETKFDERIVLKEYLKVIQKLLNQKQ